MIANSAGAFGQAHTSPAAHRKAAVRVSLDRSPSSRRTDQLCRAEHREELVLVLAFLQEIIHHALAMSVLSTSPIDDKHSQPVSRVGMGLRSRFLDIVGPLGLRNISADDNGTVGMLTAPLRHSSHWGEASL